MPFTVAQVIRQAGTILNDAGGVRWPHSEMLLWVNAATAEIANLKPTATAQTITIELSEGTKQEIPAGFHQILRVIRNTESGRAISPVTRDMMDATIPDWHNPLVLPFSVDVVNFINEPDDQGTFYVVPGNTGEGAIDVIASAVPPKIEEPADLLDIEAFDTEVPLHDIYENAVIDYVLYRCFSKDAAVVGASQRAAAYYSAFAGAMGVKAQQETTKTPDAPASRFAP